MSASQSHSHTTENCTLHLATHFAPLSPVRPFGTTNIHSLDEVPCTLSRSLFEISCLCCFRGALNRLLETIAASFWIYGGNKDGILDYKLLTYTLHTRHIYIFNEQQAPLLKSVSVEISSPSDSVDRLYRRTCPSASPATRSPRKFLATKVGSLLHVK